IFVRGADGKIAPYRAVWPNYWGRMGKDNITVIPPSVVREAAGEDLPAVRELTADAAKPLSDEQIGKVLQALSTAPATTTPATAPTTQGAGGTVTLSNPVSASGPATQSVNNITFKNPPDSVTTAAPSTAD